MIQQGFKYPVLDKRAAIIEVANVEINALEKKIESLRRAEWKPKVKLKTKLN